jgi:hypothetical protein
MDLFFGQLDARVYRVADPIQERLSGVCGLDVADPSFLKQTGATCGKVVFRHTVGAKIGAEPSIGPGEVGSRTTTVVLVPKWWSETLVAFPTTKRRLTFR